jgi:FtsH-binding integral membrane protein
MHTLRITLIGLILLSLFIFVAAQINQRKNRPAVDGAYLFLWVWLVVSVVNFCVGVFIAHYSVLTELGVHVVVFGLPAGVAWFMSRKFRSRAAQAGP